jgi:hypothetical protein
VAPGSCATCHISTYPVAFKPTSHIPTTAACDSCHRTTVWKPVTSYGHTGIAPGSCISCHTPSYPALQSKTATHIPTAAACDACHTNFSTWKPVTKYAHTGIVTGCTTCHSPTYPALTSKPTGTGHIPTADVCESCHRSTSVWIPVSSYSHPLNFVPPGSCANCHVSPYTGIKIKPNGHPATTKSCDSSGCHTTRTFSK